MEENYVTVILYIQSDFISYRGVHRKWPDGRCASIKVR